MAMLQSKFSVRHPPLFSYCLSAPVTLCTQNGGIHDQRRMERVEGQSKSEAPAEAKKEADPARQRPT